MQRGIIRSDTLTLVGEDIKEKIADIRKEAYKEIKTNGK